MDSINSLVYVKEGCMFKLDLSKYSNENIKTKGSKGKSSSEGMQLYQLSNDELIILSSDNCMKRLQCSTNAVNGLGFLCPYCHSVFPKMSVLEEHKRVHLGPVFCSGCQVGPDSNYTNYQYMQFVFQTDFIDTAMLRGHSPFCFFSCPQCDAKFKFKSQFIRHQKSHK